MAIDPKHTHTLYGVLSAKTKIYLIHLPWSPWFLFSLSSFSSWSLITIISCPSWSPWTSHLLHQLVCTNLAHDHTWWHRLVLSFHQLSKTKLGLSPFHGIGVIRRQPWTKEGSLLESHDFFGITASPRAICLGSGILIQGHDFRVGRWLATTLDGDVVN